MTTLDLIMAVIWIIAAATLTETGNVLMALVFVGSTAIAFLYGAHLERKECERIGHVVETTEKNGYTSGGFTSEKTYTYTYSTPTEMAVGDDGELEEKRKNDS